MESLNQAENRSEKPVHNTAVDLIRSVSIIFIIITHFSWGGEERLRYYFPFWVDMAVPFFMLTSGFVSALSFNRHAYDSISKAYRKAPLMGRLLRFIVPFLIVLIVEHLFLFTRAGRTIGFLSLIKRFLTGGSGPGSYYFPVMIQYVFLFPFLYCLIKSRGLKGLLYCGLLNAAFELLKWAYGMNVECYRFLIFRYIWPIAFGCYTALYPGSIKKRYYLLFFVIGLAFVVDTNYGGFEPVIINFWTNTSFVSTMFILPIFVLLLKTVRIRIKLFELLGKASYNIFLTQKLYYRCFSKSLYSVIERRSLQLLASIGICLLVGTLFYLVETPLTKKIKQLAGI